MESRTARNTREFTLADAVSPRVRVVGVHDGDTLTVISELFPGRYYIHGTVISMHVPATLP